MVAISQHPSAPFDAIAHVIDSKQGSVEYLPAWRLAFVQSPPAAIQKELQPPLGGTVMPGETTPPPPPPTLPPGLAAAMRSVTATAFDAEQE